MGERWGLDTITGRNLYGLAEVAERRGDHALAMQQLDAAGELFAGAARSSTSIR